MLPCEGPRVRRRGLNRSCASDVRQTERGLEAAQDLEAERVGVLWDFIADARACINELAVQEGEGFVLDIAAGGSFNPTNC